MSASSSLYRKYRSQTFDELVGQEPVVRTLKNAIATGRISHAYLFTGPRGVGKTSAARLLARAANCTAEGDNKPCNECPNCLAATRDIATDLVEIDAASNTGVDNIREVIERANFAPSVWNTKFYIVDEVHMLSTSAFNALLKTLEEPPPHTSFILATTEVHKVPATVASRCQRFDFRRISLKAMVERLALICREEGIEAEPAALELVARQSTGSLRDALSLLDQLRVFSEKVITLESVQDLLGAGGSEEVAAFVDSLVAQEMAEGLRRINRVMEEGLDLRQFNRQVVEHLRDLMLLKSGAASSGSVLLDVTDEMRARLQKQAEGVSIGHLLHWMKTFGEADSSLRSSLYGQLPLEMALVAATLPSEVMPRADARDRRDDIAAAVEQIAVPRAETRQRTAPPEPGSPRVGSSAPAPPPIHEELGLLSGNGKVEPPRSADVPALEEPPTIAELEPSLAPPVTQAAAPSGGADELPKLKELWEDIAAQINARSKAMAAQFRNAEMIRPLGLRNGVCTIGFRDPFHARKVQVPPYRDIAETAISRVLGYPCRVECVTFAEAEGAKAAEGDPARSSPAAGNVAREKPSPYETTRGKAAMNIFGIDKFEDAE